MTALSLGMTDVTKRISWIHTAGQRNVQAVGIGNLHCTLFLFDDKLMIVKRPGNGEKSGRVLSGLEDLEKVTKAGVLNPGAKKAKSGLVFKGVIEVGVPQFIKTDSLRVIRRNGDHRHSFAPVVIHQPDNPVFVGLRRRAMITGKKNHQDVCVFKRSKGIE